MRIRVSQDDLMMCFACGLLLLAVWRMYVWEEMVWDALMFRWGVRQ